jgi:polyisoprenoid-binding protein YceI
MKRTILLMPLLIATGAAGYIGLHPGISRAEIRFQNAKPTRLANGASYAIDPQHAGIYFEITHLGLSKVTGRFNRFSGKVVEDSGDLTRASVEFTAQVDSIDTAITARDNHLRTADFFEVSKYPEIRFKSTKVTKSKEGYLVAGDLTIKGKTRTVFIPFKHYGPLTLTAGDKSTRIGVVAEPITLKRSDFGVGGDFKLPDGTEGASNEVTVRISFEAILDK